MLLSTDDNNADNETETRHLTSDEIERLMQCDALRCPRRYCVESNDLSKCLQVMSRDVFKDWNFEPEIQAVSAIASD